MKLIFGKPNAKLIELQRITGRKLFTFSMLAGHTCPFANECKAHVEIDENGRKYLVDGPNSDYRCFSASQEVLYPPIYNSRLHNAELLKIAALGYNKAANEIVDDIPKKAGIIRIHVSGDFATLAYFDAWREAAKRRADILFYAYTKSIPFWVKRISDIPDNLILTASYGGKADKLIAPNGLRHCKVFEYDYNAIQAGYENIDHNDTFACLPENRYINFALLVHGPQKAKTKWAKAIRDNRAGYSREKAFAALAN